MDSTKVNPEENKLGQGISDQQVCSAIEGSGYPLQLVVANQLSKTFHVLEEWAFPDSATGTVRTIDLVAKLHLSGKELEKTLARPAINLVVECKKSELPYIFFLSEGSNWLRDFPQLAGLKKDHIVLNTDDDRSTWSSRPLEVLGLDRHPFLTSDVKNCTTFSKCVRKGDQLELSGSDPYHSIVFPLTYAMLHLRSTLIPPRTAVYFDCELIIALAVIDGPMVAVQLESDAPEARLTPWVRVLRHHPIEAEHKFDRSACYGIDVVHRAFLETYLEKHLLPFASDFGALVLKHNKVLAKMKGFASGLGKNSWNDIEGRLRPR